MIEMDIHCLTASNANYNLIIIPTIKSNKLVSMVMHQDHDPNLTGHRFSRVKDYEFNLKSLRMLFIGMALSTKTLP